ncbi:MAG: hypothetical protein AAF664_10585, partial [Planctomycetota bacterium]
MSNRPRTETSTKWLGLFKSFAPAPLDAWIIGSVLLIWLCTATSMLQGIQTSPHYSLDLQAPILSATLGVLSALLFCSLVRKPN